MTFARACLDCDRLTTNGNRCETCAPKAASRWANMRGPSPYADPAWRRLSMQKRKQIPYCEICGTRNSRENPLTADHIQPLSKGGALIVPLHALRTLCRRCHGAITRHK